MGLANTAACCWLLLAWLAVSVHSAFYDSFTGRQISEARYRQYQAANLIPYCAIEVRECDENERRRIDYTCNNLHSPQRGATLTPYRRLLDPDYDPLYRPRPSTSGAPLPLARNVRTGVMSDGRATSKRFTHMVPNSLVFITGDVTSVHDTINYVALTTTCCTPAGAADPRCLPIVVPNDDVHLRRSDIRCLNLTRAITYQDVGCAPEGLPPERINTATPLLDLSIIYGNEEQETRMGREFRGGRLRSETFNGREWPPSGSFLCLANQRQRGENRCHATPLHGTNILIGPTVMTVWWYRLHNTIARKLEAMNPCWDDQRLFLETRELAIALTNQIWIYELYPAVLGYDYMLHNHVIYDTWDHVDDYDPSLEPQVSIEYVIATRWFHSMQEGRIHTYDQNGKLLDELNSVELTLRTGILGVNRTMEGITQGFFRQGSAEADHLIDPDMGERVLGGFQRASDVMSSDLMKGRDAGLPPYNKYRHFCNLPVAKDFDDLQGWMPKEKVEALRLNYETVDDVDMLAGVLAESSMPNAAAGPTLACIMADQIRYWRKSDRFWYENTVHPYHFNKEQLYQIRKMTLARLICDYADEVDSIQPWAFYVPGVGNEITSCKNHPKVSLEPWRDYSCKKPAATANPAAAEAAQPKAIISGREAEVAQPRAIIPGREAEAV